MEHLAPRTSPKATAVLKHVGSLVARSRWPIVIACLLAFGLTLAFYRGSDPPVWSGRTTVKIGLAPPSDYLLKGDGAPLAAIETSRSLVARVSDPTFLAKVIDGAKFEPATAALSKQFVTSTLRGVVLDDRTVAVEVSAGSNADVEAVFRSLAAEIISIHDGIAQRRLDMLRATLTDTQRRGDFLEKTIAELGPRTSSTSREGSDPIGSQLLVPGPAGAVEFWNTLRDRAQRDANLLALAEKTTVHVEPGSYPISKRSVELGRAAMLAGFAMLAAMIVLVILVAPQRQHPN